jgi:hypothetical protein
MWRVCSSLLAGLLTHILHDRLGAYPNPVVNKAALTQTLHGVLADEAPSWGSWTSHPVALIVNFLDTSIVRFTDITITYEEGVEVAFHRQVQQQPQ